MVSLSAAGRAQLREFAGRGEKPGRDDGREIAETAGFPRTASVGFLGGFAYNARIARGVRRRSRPD